MRQAMLNRHIATNITLDYKFATNMSRIIKNFRNIINFVTVFDKMVIPFLDVSKDPHTFIEKQHLNPENKTKKNLLKQRPAKSSWKFSGTTKIHLSNELPIPTSLLINQIIETNPNLPIKNSPRRNSSSYDLYDRQSTNRRHTSNTRPPTPNRYHNEHQPHNLKNSLISNNPHQNTSDGRSPSLYQRYQSSAINKNANDFEEVFQTAFLDNTMTDVQFLDYCIYFDVGVLETKNTLDITTKLGSSWYVHLNVPLEK